MALSRSFGLTMQCFTCGRKYRSRAANPHLPLSSVFALGPSPFSLRKARVVWGVSLKGGCSMRHVKRFAVATVSLGVLAGFAAPAAAQVTAFEGARVIVGDGSAAIENATLIIDGGKI